MLNSLNSSLLSALKLLPTRKLSVCTTMLRPLEPRGVTSIFPDQSRDVYLWRLDPPAKLQHCAPRARHSRGAPSAEVTWKYRDFTSISWMHIFLFYRIGLPEADKKIPRLVSKKKRTGTENLKGVKESLAIAEIWRSIPLFFIIWPFICSRDLKCHSYPLLSLFPFVE